VTQQTCFLCKKKFGWLDDKFGKTSLSNSNIPIPEGFGVEDIICYECLKSEEKRLQTSPPPIESQTSGGDEILEEKDNKNQLCQNCNNNVVTFESKTEMLCSLCFSKKYGMQILHQRFTEYYGGHKAYPAGGYFTQYQAGELTLTDSHLIFVKKDRNTVKRWDIIIPLKSIRVDGWRIEEESRRQTIVGGGGGIVTGSGIGGGGGGGMIHQEGKAHHIVIPYVDENGIPQEPRFGISSFGGKAIREWSEKIYNQIVIVKKNNLPNSTVTKTPEPQQDPLIFLKLRLAKGEISKEEYEDLKKTLEK